MEKALEIKKLYYSYQELPVLRGINMSLRNGELGVLLGASGSGKSTLIKCIAQLIEYEEGKIFIHGEEITGKEPKDLGIGYVPQGQILFPNLTIKDNIAFGLKARRWPREMIEKKISELSNLLEIKSLLSRKPHQLSGGQKQRIAIARALAIDPKLLLLDEPLASVDAFNKENLALEIKHVQKETMTTTIYVTHDQFEARLVADIIMILDEGKIIQQDYAEHAFQNPTNIKAAIFMGIPNSIPKELLRKKFLEEFNPKTGVILPPKKIAIENVENHKDIKKEKNDYILLNARLVKYSFDQHQNQFGIFETTDLTLKKIRIQVLKPKIMVGIDKRNNYEGEFILKMNKNDIVVL